MVSRLTAVWFKLGSVAEKDATGTVPVDSFRSSGQFQWVFCRGALAGAGPLDPLKMAQLKQEPDCPAIFVHAFKETLPGVARRESRVLCTQILGPAWDTRSRRRSECVPSNAAQTGCAMPSP